MTVKEYLLQRIDQLDTQCTSFIQGKLAAFQEMLKVFPTLEHSITLEEVKNLCKTEHWRAELGFETNPVCPLQQGSACSAQCPKDWNIPEIENKIKEVRNGPKTRT
jgi:hypothetical protein